MYVFKRLCFCFGALTALLVITACSTPGSMTGDDGVMGIEGAVCYPNGTCNDGLVCLSDVCVLDTGWRADKYTVNCSDGMCLIPAGSFWIGCNELLDDACEDDEYPYVQEELPGFFIDKTEVTVAAYGKCVDANLCRVPSTDNENCNWVKVGKENDPMDCVPLLWAAAYCESLGKRLPTEAEWEKAARGTDGRKYPWGNDMTACDKAVMRGYGDFGCGTGGTMDVCSKSPAGDSPYGLCDMSGNVWEWVSDRYQSAANTGADVEIPQGDDNSNLKVVRGGGFGDGAYDIFRVSNRDYKDASVTMAGLGFRCAMDAP